MCCVELPLKVPLVEDGPMGFVMCTYLDQEQLELVVDCEDIAKNWAKYLNA